MKWKWVDLCNSITFSGFLMFPLQSLLVVFFPPKPRCQGCVPKWILRQRECACITYQYGDPLSCGGRLLRGACIMKNRSDWQGVSTDRRTGIGRTRHGQRQWCLQPRIIHVLKALIWNYREEASLWVEGVEIVRLWSVYCPKCSPLSTHYVGCTQPVCLLFLSWLFVTSFGLSYMLLSHFLIIPH